MNRKVTKTLFFVIFLALPSVLMAKGGWVNVTSQYINDPSFESGNYDEWTMTRQLSSGNIQSMYGVMEMWNSKFRLEKKITNVTNGKYRFSLNGYYRTADHYIAYPNHKNGTESIVGYLFANNQETQMSCIYDYSFTTPPSSYSYYTADDGKYYPDHMGAAEQAFGDGLYPNSVEFDVTDGTIDIGVYNSAYESGNWLVIDNIKIEQWVEDLAEIYSLVVNEVQTANIDQYIDYSNNYGGWIELYNPTSETIAIDNCYISNDPENLKLFQLTGLGPIEAKGYKVIYFDHNSSEGSYGSEAYKNVPFKLDADGGTLYLSDDSGNEFLKFDYPESISRCSYARTTDGGDSWRWTGTPTLEATNTTSTFADTQLAAPVVDLESGLLSGTTSVYFSVPDGVTIRYTLDGSTPTLTNGTVLNTNSLGITQTTILRCRAFRDGYLPSQVVTRSYLFNDRTYTLPIISIVTDNKNLYDNTIGVYTVGTNGISGRGINYASNKNMDWERPVNFEFITTDGKCVLNQETDFYISGGWSRHWPPTSFKLKAEKQYEHRNSLDYSFFKEKPHNRYKTIVVRNGGNDTSCRVHDAMVQEIISTSGFYVDTQAFQPAHVLLNGQYLGMLNIREPNNKFYGYSNYGLDTDEMDAFELYTSVYYQKAGTKDAFNNWVSLAKSASNASKYEEIKQVVDIDEYINYMAAECYIGSSDWLTNNNNYKGFRSRNDGKFHTVMFDTDAAWDISDMLTRLKGNTSNSLITLFNNMALNKDFKRQFIDAYCLVAGSVFEATRSGEVADSIAAMTNSALSLEGKSSSARASSVRSNTSDSTKRNTRMQALKSYFDLCTGMALSLSANVEGASLLMNGQHVPTCRFSGTIFPEVKIEASAPAGYNFVGWNKGEITSTAILSRGSTWYYYDQGSLDGKNWKTGSINWPSGISPLGYGKSGLGTVISYGNDSNNKRPTYYFRQTISLNDAPTSDETFTLSYTVDDGFAIYVNGVEAGRHLLNKDATYSSYATTYCSGNPDTGTMSLKPSLFHKGENIIAVEVHNNSTTSSDIYWNAEILRSTVNGNIVSTDRTYTFTSNDPCALQAVFEPLPEECLNAAKSTPVVINEISAANSIYVNDYFKKNDWIELYNTTNKDIDLEGMYLSDNPDNPQKYQISKVIDDDNSTIIHAHGYKVIWADKLDPMNQLHASFKLGNADGESVVLTAADGSWADSLTYMSHTGEESVGRYPDGGKRVFKMSRTTIGARNALTSYAEWLSGEDKNFDVEGYLAGINSPDDNRNSNDKAIKSIENGQVVITRGGRKYTLSGQRIK